MTGDSSLLPLLAVFASVVERGSFSGAARDRVVTASAVSRQITRLEERLALRLFERTTRRLRLTEAGEAVYEEARAMVEAGRAALRLGEQLNGHPRGVVHLSVAAAFGRVVINPLMPEFLRRYPDVSVHLVLDDIAPDLAHDDFDLSIQVTDNPPGGLAGRPLVQVRQILCASPDYLRQQGTPRDPQDLLRHSCLYLAQIKGDDRWRFERDGELRTVAVRGRYASNHSGARLALAEAGLGIACLPHFMAADALAQGRVVTVLPDWRFTGAYQGQAWLLWRPNPRLPPRTRVLVDYLAEKLAR